MTNLTSKDGARLRDVAVFVRSKNAGPFMLTIDLFFHNAQECEQALTAGVLTPVAIADIYDLEASAVKLIHVAPAYAIKISFPRPLAAGDIGDSDVAGGQQFAPLLDLVLPGTWACRRNS